MLRGKVLPAASGSAQYGVTSQKTSVAKHLLIVAGAHPDFSLGGI
jgi:hypothetical protein